MGFILSVLSMLSVSVAALPNSYNINCITKRNLQVDWKSDFPIEQGERRAIHKTEDYVLYVKVLQSNTLELEAFFPAQEARVYAEGSLNQDGVRLTQWTRDLLFEMNCKGKL